MARLCWDLVRRSKIQEGLRVDLLCLHTKRLRWFGHLIRLSTGYLTFGVYQAWPAGQRSCRWPRTCWRDYISKLAWEQLGIPQEKLEEFAGDREVFLHPLLLLRSWNGLSDFENDVDDEIAKLREKANQYTDSQSLKRAPTFFIFLPLLCTLKLPPIKIWNALSRANVWFIHSELL